VLRRLPWRPGFAISHWRPLLPLRPVAGPAYLLFLAFLAHFGAILLHTLVVRDGMLFRMVPWNVRPREVVRGSGQPTSRSERLEV
jgi:hypothetical protein